MTRRIVHPGPPGAERVVAVPAGAVPVEATLAAGSTLLDAVAALLRPPVESLCLTLTGGGFGPFAYVIPSLPPDPSHVAFYSDTRRPAGMTRLEVAAITVGWRDGAPFFHCHGLWTEADGRRGCGHLLPEGTVIAAPIQARGSGLTGARFTVAPDAETGFSLFSPRPSGTARGAPALALRLAPNQDLITALERAGHEAGFARAAVHGGVASVLEARFTDAPPIEGFATELLVRAGAIRCDGRSGAESTLDVAIVDYRGAIGTGHLVRGDNPVLMTFEGVLLQA